MTSTATASTTSTSVTTPDYPELTPPVGSRFPDVHGTNQRRVVTVLAASSEYVAARRALAAFDAWQPEFAAEPLDPTADVVDRILGALDGGEDLPRVLTDWVPDVTAVRSQNLIAGRAGADTRARLVNRLDELVAPRLPQVRGATGAELVEVVVAARQLGQVPTDAADAIREGRVEEFRAAEQLEHQYVDLRRLQLSIVRGGDSAYLARINGGASEALHFVANAADVLGVEEVADGLTERVRPRLDLPTSWASGDALRWFVRHSEAVPWCPSYAELNAALVSIRSNLTPVLPPSSVHAGPTQWSTR